MNDPATRDLVASLSANERELLSEMIRALRSIRYGSVVLTVHEGRVVEVNKTERIRKGSASQT